MRNRVEIADDPEGPEEGTQNIVRQIFPVPDPRLFSVFHDHEKREQRGDNVPEKRLLHGGNIARHADKQIHDRKAEGREDDEKDPLVQLRSRGLLRSLTHTAPYLLYCFDDSASRTESRIFIQVFEYLRCAEPYIISNMDSWLLSGSFPRIPSRSRRSQVV